MDGGGRDAPLAVSAAGPVPDRDRVPAQLHGVEAGGSAVVDVRLHVSLDRGALSVWPSACGFERARGGTVICRGLLVR